MVLSIALKSAKATHASTLRNASIIIIMVMITMLLVIAITTTTT